MGGTLLAPFFGLAILDSINPSALAVTLVLMAQPQFVPRALAYVTAVFATYLAFGVALMLGLNFVWTRLNPVAGYAFATLAGAALLGYALFAPDRPARDAAPRLAAGGLVAMAVLGASITVAELSTALPYLGAVSLLAEAKLVPAAWFALLAAYNVVFVAPPLAIVAGYMALGDRIRPRLERWEAALRRGARSTLLWLMGAAGFLLLTRGGALLAAELGWIEVPGIGPSS